MNACMGKIPHFCRRETGKFYSCDISCGWTLFLMRQFMRHLMRHSCGIDATSQAPGEFLFMRYSCGIHAEFMRHSCGIHAAFMRHSCDISSARGILFMRGLMRDLPHGIREAKRLSERSHPPCALRGWNTRIGESQECQGQVAAVSHLRSGMTRRSQKAAGSNHWALVHMWHFPLNMNCFPCPGSRAGVMISCLAFFSPRVLPVCLVPWLFLVVMLIL